MQAATSVWRLCLLFLALLAAAESDKELIGECDTCDLCLESSCDCQTRGESSPACIHCTITQGLVGNVSVTQCAGLRTVSADSDLPCGQTSMVVYLHKFIWIGLLVAKALLL